MLQEDTKINSHLIINENESLIVALFQMDIVWENKTINLEKVHQQIINISGKADILVLPEMFSTGFSMNVENLTEANNGSTITFLQSLALQYNIAICGSFIASENRKNYNRAFYITPQDVSFHDKRHLFRIGNESIYYSAGNNLNIVSYKGFNICILICYDLRFPVWSRNVDNKYDLLIYVANWPQSRIAVWETLLSARAIENMAYVCGVNRIGVDGSNLIYNGHSAMFDFKGNNMISQQVNISKETCLIVEINKKQLNLFRSRFSVWKDADKFTLS